jgi:hypothetical protein
MIACRKHGRQIADELHHAYHAVQWLEQWGRFPSTRLLEKLAEFGSRPLRTMTVIRIFLGLVGLAGLLIWPVLCLFFAMAPKFQIGPPQGPGLSSFELLFYVIAPLLAFAYYAAVSIARPRRFLAIVGVALHLGLIAAQFALMRSPDRLLITFFVFGGVLSFWYESRSFSRPTVHQMQ